MNLTKTLYSDENKTVRKKPTYCCLAITETCFLHCRICYKWKDAANSPEPEGPSLNQWKGFIDSLKDLVDVPFQLNFAGGEPLIHEHTLPLIRHASDRGFKTLLASNGWLIDEDMAKRINDSGLSVISLSLDGIDEKTHDYIRGTKGSYDRVLRAIGLLNKYCPDLQIYICTLISAVNLNELKDLVLWINNNHMIHGMSFQALTQPFNTPIETDWYLKPEYSYLWPQDSSCVNDVIDSLIDLRKDCVNNKINNPVSQLLAFKAYFKNPKSFLKEGVTCHLDETAINVTLAGDIFFCFYMDPIGNVKTDRISEIWHSEKNEEARRHIKNCKRNCQAVVNCNYEEQEINI